MLKAAVNDSLIYGLGSLLSKGISIFLLPLYTYSISVSEYGIYDLLITLGALVNLTIAFEILQGLMRYWPDTLGDFKKKQLASTSLWFTLFMYAIFFALTLSIAPMLCVWILGETRYLTEFKLGLGFIAANGIFYFMINQLRSELRSIEYTLINFIYALMTAIFTTTLCLLYNMGLSGVILGQLLASIFSSIMSTYLLRKTFGFLFDFHQLKIMLKFSIPLVPAGLATFSNIYTNRFALNHFATLDDVGLFGMATRLAGLSSLFIIGIQGALTPLIYQNYQSTETPNHIAKLFSWFMTIALTGCLCLTLYARELLMIFANNEYYNSATLIIFLAPAFLLSQMYIFAPGIAIMKRSMLQFTVTALAALASIIGNLILVPIWGSIGAAIATLLASLAFFLAWLIVSQQLYCIPYAKKACLLSTVAYILASIIGYTVDKFIPELFIVIVIKMIIILCMLLAIIKFGLLQLSDVRFALHQVRQRLIKGRSV